MTVVNEFAGCVDLPSYPFGRSIGPIERKTMSTRARTRGGRKTRCLQVLGCAAAATVVALVGAGIADADEAGYLDELGRHGYLVTAPTGEYLLGSGHAMCKELNAGHSPDYVAKHWTYPNASYQNLLDMATAAENNLCGGD
jgi:hypothetical protein